MREGKTPPSEGQQVGLQRARRHSTKGHGDNLLNVIIKNIGGIVT